MFSSLFLLRRRKKRKNYSKPKQLIFISEKSPEGKAILLFPRLGVIGPKPSTEDTTAYDNWKKDVSVQYRLS